MLDNVTSVSQAPAPINIDGRTLSHLNRAPAAHRALMAFEITTGAITLNRLARSQAAPLCNVALSYVSAVAHIDPATRLRLRARPELLTRLHHDRVLTDAAIDAFVAKVGAERIFNALDRLTTPRALATE